MLVLHVVESLDLRPGAVVISLDGIVAPLAAMGIQSRIVAEGEPGKVQQHGDARDARPLDVEHVLGQVDIVHIHAWGYGFADRVARAAIQLRKPLVLSPHGALCAGPYDREGWLDRLRRRWRQRRLIRAVRVVTALNKHEETAVSRAHSSVRLLPYGLAFDDYRMGADASANPGERWIVMLGSLHPRGGCVALLKALAEVGPEANGWNLALVGADDGQWRRMLEPAVRRKGGEERVRFDAGAIVDAQREWLSRASLVAAPSLQPTFPLSIMQALAAGVPVLASNLASPPGLDGLIRVCGPRRDELREALRAVLARPDKARRDSAKAAVSAARMALDWSVLAPRWSELYRELI